MMNFDLSFGFQFYHLYYHAGYHYIFCKLKDARTFFTMHHLQFTSDFIVTSYISA